MVAPIPPVKLTYDDYLCLPEDGKCHEIIDGEHCVTPAPSTKHQRVSGHLFAALYTHIRDTDAGQLFAAPTDVQLSEVDIVQPDLLFISHPRLSIIGPQFIQGAPDLVIEILSEATRRRDERVKLNLYDRHGVDEYWVVDPEAEMIVCYRRSGSQFVEAATYHQESGDQLTTPLFPGLQLSLAALFV